MQASFDNLKRHFLSRAFLIFLIVGCINTFLCSALAKGMESLVDSANLAFNIGYILSNINAYFLNSKLVFPTTITIARNIKFALSYVPNYIIQNIIVAIVYNMLGFPSLASFLIAAVLGVPITFLCVKLFAFGRC